MQDSLKKFREEAQKLEESEALKEARRKFESIEGESTKGSNVIKEQISGIADKVKGVKDKLDDVEALKKATEIGNDTLVLNQFCCLILLFPCNPNGCLFISSYFLAGDAKKVVGEKVEQIGKSGAFQVATSSAATLKKEIEGQRLGARVYIAPGQLRKRKQQIDHVDGEDNECK